MRKLECENCGSIVRKFSKGSRKTVKKCSKCVCEFPDDAVESLIKGFLGGEK